MGTHPRIRLPAGERSCLVIDDDELVRDHLTNCLSSLGFAVSEDRKGDSLDALLAANDPDLVLLDIALGDTDAVALLKRLAQLNFAGTVVVVSGMGADVTAAVIETGKRHGLTMAGVLAKPFRMRQLEDVIRAAGLMERTSSLLIDMDKAITEGWLDLLYQPVLSLADRRIVGLEALLRVDHPRFGMIQADQFIPTMRQSSPTNVLRYVMGKAYADLGTLWEQKIRLPMSINVGRDALNQPDLLSEILAARPSGTDIPNLLLEFNETDVADNFDQVRDLFVQLRIHRLKPVIDRVGNGKCVLPKLAELKPSALKFDRELIFDISSSEDRRFVCSLYTQTARKYAITTTATGIEAKSDLEAAVALQIDNGQGFIFRPPMQIGALIDSVRPRGRMPAAGAVGRDATGAR